MQNGILVSNRAWLFIAAMAMVLVLVAACSSGGDNSSSTTTSSVAAVAPQQPAAAAAPQGSTDSTSSAAAAAPAPTAIAAVSAPTSPVSEPKITRVIIGNPAPSAEGNNPNIELGPLTTFQIGPTFEYLIGYDPATGDLVPQLAESWSVEPDGISTRFKLRKGVQFHSGWGEFTAADVVFTHAQIVRDDSLHAISRRYKLATIEVVNDYEIVFKLSRANAEALKQISEQVGGLEIESAANFAESGLPDLTTSPLAGTGAYQFKERIQGQKVVFQRVPYDHWRYTPDFPELEYRWMGEASTRLAALLTDEVHITQLPEDLIPQAEADGMKLISGALSGQRVFLSFKGVYLDSKTACGYRNCDSPFLDRNVRQALNRAVNRDELNTAFFGGKGQKMVMNHIPPTASYWNTDWDRDFDANWGFNPTAARALLAESGYNDDNPLEVGVEVTTHSQYGQSADVLEIIAGYWNDIGVKANLLTIDYATNRANTRAFKYTDHVSFAATASFDIQGWRVYNSHVVPRGGSLELINTGALIDQLQAEMDSAKQNVLLRQIGDMAFNEYMGIYLYWIPAQLVINPNFVASYNFPGSLSAIWTHYELLKAN